MSFLLAGLLYNRKTTVSGKSLQSFYLTHAGKNSRSNNLRKHTEKKIYYIAFNK